MFRSDKARYDSEDDVPFAAGDTVTVKDSYEAEVLGLEPQKGRVSLMAACAPTAASGYREVFIEDCEPAE